jgi:fibronectin type 3 domain-containing protein
MTAVPSARWSSILSRLRASRQNSRRSDYLLNKAVIEALEPRVLLSYVVTSLADNGSAGTLRYEIEQADAAGGNQTITFTSSLTASGPAAIDLNGNALTLDDTSGTLTIQGPGANLLSIDAQGLSSALNIDSGSTASIDGLTIANGHSTYGGGISNTGTLTITNSTVSDNFASEYGGGIFNYGPLTITNSLISGNTADGGRGGGGISNYGGGATLDMTACTISGNSSAGNGGGIASYNGTLNLINCTISGNHAAGGGGISDYGQTSIIDSTISGNSATDGGGGIATYVANFDNLEGTIVAGNSGGDLAGTGFTGTYNLIGDGSGGLTGSSNIQGNPRLAALGYYGGTTETMPLLPGSLALNAGSVFDDSDGNHITTDQRGFTRPQSSTSDIGAFQNQSNPLLVNTTVDDPVGSGLLSLRDAISLADAMGGNQTITFASSLTSSAATIDLNGSALTLDDPSGTLTIQGPAMNLLSIDAQALSNVFSIDSGSTAALDGLTVAGGQSTYGGGISNTGTLTISNCTVSDNFASEYGGGIFNTGTGLLTISDSLVSGNTADGARAGGGVCDYGGLLDITACTITGNSSAGNGGGISNYNGTANVIDCTITGNSASFGGGISSYGATNIIDSTVSGNTHGGGIAAYTANFDTLEGTIVADNSGGDLLSSWGFAGTYNLIGDGSGGLSSASSSHNILGTTSSPINPLLAPLGNYGGPTETMALLPGSPALDAGAVFDDGSGNPILTDQRGITRPQGADPDIGAFESQGYVVQATNDSGTQTTYIDTPFSNLTVHVTAVDPGLTDLAGGIITFTAPTSGASAILGTPAPLDSSNDTSVTATANNIVGSYSVTASTAPSVSTDANFSLTNILEVPGNLAATAASDTQVNLTWTNNALNATSIVIQRSTDDVNWRQIANPTPNTDSYQDTGLTAETQYYYQVFADINGTLSAASNTATVGTLPPGWTDIDIGSPGVSGTASYNSVTGAFTLGGSGADISESSDQLNLASELFSGDGTLIAEVDSLQSTNPWASAGVTFRGSADPSDVDAAVLATAGEDVVFEWRDAQGDLSSYSVTGPSGPVWVELIQSQGQFSGYYSTDGSTWVQIGQSETVNMATDTRAGLAVSAQNNSFLNTAVISNVQFTGANDGTGGGPGPTGEVPNTPTDFSYSVTSPIAINLTWSDNDPTVDQYVLYEQVDGGNWQQTDTFPVGQSSYPIGNLNPDSDYNFELVAENSAGSSGFTELEVQLPPPTAPSALQVTSTSNSAVSLQWTTSIGADDYEVQRSVDDDIWTTIASSTNDSNTYTDSTVDDGTTYYYQVIAFNDNGDSLPSNVVSTTTNLNAPTGLSATAVSADTISLQWTNNSDGDQGFEIQDQIAGGDFTDIATAPMNAENFTVTGLNQQTSYTFRIAATGSSSPSGWSNTAGATTLQGGHWDDNVAEASPDTFSDTIEPFGDFPAGTYRVDYLSGAIDACDYEPDQWGVAGTFVAGGNQVGQIIFYPYESAADASAAAQGASLTFYNPGGEIGVQLIDNPYTDNAGGNTFSLDQWIAPDVPTVSVAPTVPNTTEGSSNYGQLTFTRTVDDNNPVTQPLTVYYTLAGSAIPEGAIAGDGSALQPDYDGPTGGSGYSGIYSVLIPAGSTTATVPIIALSGSAHDGNEQAIVSIEGNNSYEIGSGSASVTIVDPQLSLSWGDGVTGIQTSVGEVLAVDNNPVSDDNSGDPASDYQSLSQLNLGVPSDITSGTISLSINSGASEIEVFSSDAESGNPLLNSNTTSMSWNVGSQPSSVWVEAVGASQSDGDINFALTWTPLAANSPATQNSTNATAVNVTRLTLSIASAGTRYQDKPTTGWDSSRGYLTGLPVLYGSGMLTLAATTSSTANVNLQNQIFWTVLRNTNDAPALGNAGATPSIARNPTNPLQATLTDNNNVIGSFVVFIYENAQGQGPAFTPQSKILGDLHLVEVGMTVQTSTVVANKVAFQTKAVNNGNTAGTQFLANGDVMTETASVLLTGGGPNGILGLSGVHLGWIGNVGGKGINNPVTLAGTYAGGETETESASAPFPLLDTSQPPVPFRASSTSVLGAAQPPLGELFTVSAGDNPKPTLLNPFPNTPDPITSLQGGYKLTEFLSADASTFASVYVAAAMDIWSVNYNYGLVGGNLADKGSSVTVPNNQQATILNSPQTIANLGGTTSLPTWIQSIKFTGYHP